mmetsp:Transcript_586/g.1646  ORF Transcript_586/g.1646 Transcript_586/m.1646 type:complete len:268 (-) Transcript_586:132-935(-)
MRYGGVGRLPRGEPGHLDAVRDGVLPAPRVEAEAALAHVVHPGVDPRVRPAVGVDAGQGQRHARNVVELLPKAHVDVPVDAVPDGVARPRPDLQRAALQLHRRTARDPRQLHTPGDRGFPGAAPQRKVLAAGACAVHPEPEVIVSRAGDAGIEAGEPARYVGCVRKGALEANPMLLLSGDASIGRACQRQYAHVHEGRLGGGDPRDLDAVRHRVAPGSHMQTESLARLIAGPHLDPLAEGRRGVEARQLHRQAGDGPERAPELDLNC